MTLSEFVESKAYKNVMKYVYGWGAAVVLAGALFKIQHYPGAGIMLVLGMGAEILIFFLSAFEPLHEEPDWTLVYPELAGMTNDLDDGISRESHAQRDSRLFNVSQLPPSGFQSNEEGNVVGQQVGSNQGGVISNGGSGFALQRFDELLEQAELGPDLFVKMGQGIEKLATTAESLNQMQDIVETTNGFSDNMKSASEAVSHLSETYNSSNDILQNATSTLSEASVKAASTIEKSGISIGQTAQESAESIIRATDVASKQLIDNIKNYGEVLGTSYQKLSSDIDEGLNSLKSGTKTYSEQIEAQNKQLTALNSIYELHMTQLSEQNQKTEKLFQRTTDTLQNMSDVAEDSLKFKESWSKLNDNLASLNSVYGNMLSTFNLKND